MSRLRSHRDFDAGVFFGKKTFAPDVYPDSGRPWNVLLASAEHERHRVQDASAVGRSLMKRVLEADPQQASKGIG